MRGMKGQKDKRTMERDIRKGVVAFRRWTARHGLGQGEAASHLGMSGETLKDWEHKWKTDRLQVQPKGRPASKSDRWVRNQIITRFHLMGPAAGLVRYEAMFPDVTAEELRELLWRYRKVYTRRTSILVHMLFWSLAGSVWAMDYTDPPKPVDGVFPRILVARDLPSGEMLLSLPVKRKDAATAGAEATRLFKEYGAPLVVKGDADFSGSSVTRVFSEWEVFLLLSPPRTPQYNGACEAGVGTLKAFAEYEAMRNGRPGEWTCDDVEAARLLANETARPKGASGPTPDETWRQRLPITPYARATFAESVGRYREEARRDLGFLPHIELSGRDAATVDRMAIPEALEAHGILSYRRRRIRPLIKGLSRGRIT